jgi:3-isopropylmalate/(R)-2-methylmalate dehydratase small subunit
VSLRGSVFRLPEHLWDDVNTDSMLPARHLRAPEEELGDHAFAGELPGFRERLNGAGVLVGGSNMGCGSSREQAPKALIGAGVRLVIAQSFGSIFFRNSFNLGLALMRVEATEALDVLHTGETVEADLASGLLTLGTGTVVQGQPLGSYLQRIVSAGGILKLLAERPDALV